MNKLSQADGENGGTSQAASTTQLPTGALTAKQWLKHCVLDTGTAGNPHRWAWKDRDDLTDAEMEKPIGLPELLEAYAAYVAGGK